MKPDSMSALPIPGGIQSMLKGFGIGGEGSGTSNDERGAPAAPVFGQANPKKPKAASNVASFLNSAMTPSANERGTKTLTGQ